MPPNQAELLRLKNIIVAKFTKENWLDIGLITNNLELIQSHHRLLRSLDWGDTDYGGHATEVLMRLASTGNNLALVADYVETNFGDAAEGIAITDGATTIRANPMVFKIPTAPREDRLVAVMMPFAKEYDTVYATIKDASRTAACPCQRVSDIWQDSVLVQDIFDLIYRAKVVVCDFTGKNPNVMYEAGIAHTLGRPVIPITQHKGDIPFDLQHHRFLSYLPNAEGLDVLNGKLLERLLYLVGA